MNTATISAPDLIEIVNEAAPGQDGVSLLYSIAGGVDFRIARLAAMITNSMAAHILESGQLGVEGFNEAINALDEATARSAAFHATGLDHQDMLEDLKALVAFRVTLSDKIMSITGKPFAARWAETIMRAAEPREVEEWKLVDGWNEYVEACHGKPEMTEAEHREMEKIELSGKKQNWGSFIPQIIDTIKNCGDEGCEFHDLPVQTQHAILASISTDEKMATMRTNAKKMARSPAELHAKRMLISDFIARCRLALKHSRYANIH